MSLWVIANPTESIYRTVDHNYTNNYTTTSSVYLDYGNV